MLLGKSVPLLFHLRASARHHVSSPVTSEAAMFTAATVAHISLEGRASLPAWASPTASEP